MLQPLILKIEQVQMFSSCIAFKLLTNFSGLTNNYSSQHIWYFMSYENILLGFVLELRRQHNWNTNANHNRLNLIGPTLLYVTKKEPFMPHDIACIEVRLLSKLIEVLNTTNLNQVNIGAVESKDRSIWF